MEDAGKDKQYQRHETRLAAKQDRRECFTKPASAAQPAVVSVRDIGGPGLANSGRPDLTGGAPENRRIGVRSGLRLLQSFLRIPFGVSGLFTSARGCVRAAFFVVALALMAGLIPQPASAESHNRDQFREIQQMLTQCGFDPGAVYGRWGQKTARAAAEYIQAHGLSVRAGGEYSLTEQVGNLVVLTGGPCPNVSRDDQAEAPADEKDDDLDSLIAEVRKSSAAFNEVVLDWCDKQGGEFVLPGFFAPGCIVGDFMWAANLGLMNYDAAWWWDMRIGSRDPVDFGVLWFVWPTEMGCESALAALRNPARVPVTLFGPNVGDCQQ